LDYQPATVNAMVCLFISSCHSSLSYRPRYTRIHNRVYDRLYLTFIILTDEIKIPNKPKDSLSRQYYNRTMDFAHTHTHNNPKTKIISFSILTTSLKQQRDVHNMDTVWYYAVQRSETHANICHDTVQNECAYL
jgi:hypothetical protein